MKNTNNQKGGVFLVVLAVILVGSLASGLVTYSKPLTVSAHPEVLKTGQAEYKVNQ